jgi:Protein of unknown function (DUF2752)
VTTYPRVQAALACAFALLLGALTLLARDGGHLSFFGKDLPPLCRAETSPCPSCGLTRGMVAVLDGDFSAARTLHPSALAASLLLAFEVLLRIGLTRLSLGRNAALAAGVLDFSVHFAVVRRIVNGAAVMA